MVLHEKKKSVKKNFFKKHKDLLTVYFFEMYRNEGSRLYVGVQRDFVLGLDDHELNICVEVFFSVFILVTSAIWRTRKRPCLEVTSVFMIGLYLTLPVIHLFTGGMYIHYINYISDGSHHVFKKIETLLETLFSVIVPGKGIYPLSIY